MILGAQTVLNLSLSLSINATVGVFCEMGVAIATVETDYYQKMIFAKKFEGSGC